MQESDARQTIYEAAGGQDGILRLAGAWHRRVLEDEVVSHAFSHGYHPLHTERLAAYWAEALGGPAVYSQRYGNESSVVRMHSGNGPHDDMDERAIACFDRALEDAGLAGDERLRRALHDYFAWTMTSTLSRYPDSAADVPPDLRMPKWSWDGVIESDDNPPAPSREEPDLVRLLGAFADAWNRHDIDALMSMMTDDPVFEASAGPRVCGERHEGREAVRSAYQAVFAQFPDARWADARHFVIGTRGVSEWTFTGTRRDGTRVEVNGCDLFTFRNGKIALKNSFRKNRSA